MYKFVLLTLLLLALVLPSMSHAQAVIAADSLKAKTTPAVSVTPVAGRMKVYDVRVHNCNAVRSVKLTVDSGSPIIYIAPGESWVGKLYGTTFNFTCTADSATVFYDFRR